MVAVAFGLMGAGGFPAFGQVCPRGRVVDAAGAAVPGALVVGVGPGGREERVTADAAGAFALACPAGWSAGAVVRASAPGMESAPGWASAPGTESASGLAGVSGSAGAAGAGDGETVLVVRPSALREQVTVVATRSAVSVGPQALTTVAIDAEELRRFPALALDERLRQVAGFELFRRASSWVANPTSQGVSLRGLGSTAASRTLVLVDGAPLNDGFGGWVHWNEIPPDAVEGVTVATGGGSDLYGSSALGGVIDVLPARPRANLFDGTLAGAAEDTTDAHGRLDLAQGRWGEMVAGEGFRTAGYVPTAPQFVGPIDRPANVHYQTGRVVLERRLGGRGRGAPPSSSEVQQERNAGVLRSAQKHNQKDEDSQKEVGAVHSNGFTQRVFLTGNLLNEARGNGTAVQTNGSRIWRWMAGDEWAAGERGSGRVRVFGSDEGYRQSFSSINATRNVEMLTRLQRSTTQEVGGSTDAAVHWGHAAVVLGGDVRDLRANDAERPVSRGVVSSVATTPARQRFVGGFAEGLASWGRWSGAASLRVDSAQNLDTRTKTFTTAGVPAGPAAVIPNRAEMVVSPRVGLVRELGRGFEAHAAGFRAFRSPTMNELYRQGQVGQELTLANPQLASERATGAEGGVGWQPGGARVGAEATYFWTEINRPVSAVLVSSTATTITNVRENLGQIQSQGMELRVRLNEGRAVSGAVGYQYAHAVVTQFSVQPGLVGRWIPQVPRQSFTAQLRAARARWGEVTVAARASGQAYDDSSNLFALHRFFAMDVYGERGLGRGWTAFVSVQNVLNQRMEVARTPLLTLGNPVLAQGGVRFGWGGR